MATIKNQIYVFYIALSEGGQFKVNPTIAVGDFQVKTGSGAYANLLTTPVVEPAGSSTIKVTLSAAEMNDDKVMVLAHDEVGNEWLDSFVFIDTETGSISDAVDILEGDHVETKNRLIINKKGTATPIVDKVITGSLLSDGVTIATVDTP